MTKINLLDLMPPEQKQRFIDRYKERITPDESKGEIRVSPEIFLLSELGFYYGWDAIEAVRRDEICMNEVFALVEGAKRVYHSNVLKQTHSRMSAIKTVNSDDPQGVFNKTMKRFIENSAPDE